MEQPKGFIIDENLVCLLLKSLYGLKQAPRVWNQKIHRYLKDIGFTQTHADHCVYINQMTGIILAIWVDDLIIFGREMESINQLKKDLWAEFEMKDLGELKYFLGIKVTRNRQARQITIDQSTYIRMVLERFGMQDCNPAYTPMATGVKLEQAAVEDILVDERQYQSIVGSLMYAMLCTRPDLAYAISQLSQFNAKPTSKHEAAAKRVLRYLKGTTDLGITYEKDKNGLSLEGYSDADWEANEDRKSISGYIFMFNGGIISWQSKKQPTVTLSTTESEYMALLQAIKELIWIQRLLDEVGRNAEKNNIIYEDNQSTIALASNPQFHARTKHIDIQYHFIHECVENSKVQLEYCSTTEMIADGMTKIMAKDRHWHLMEKMGMEMQQHHDSETNENLRSNIQ
jgi:hypothetical protein